MGRGRGGRPRARGAASSFPTPRRCSSRRARPRRPPFIRSRRSPRSPRTRETLLIVDGITAVGVYDVPMDRSGIDVLVTGSQKALMLPPGLAFRGAQRARLEARRQAASAELLLRPESRTEEPGGQYDGVHAGGVARLRTPCGARACSSRKATRTCLRRHARLAAATRAAGAALGLKPARAACAEPGGHRSLHAGRHRRRQAHQVPARQGGRQLRRRAGSSEGQDRAHRAHRLLRRVRHRHGDRGARDGARQVRRTRRSRQRRRGGAARAGRRLAVGV